MDANETRLTDRYMKRRILFALGLLIVVIGGVGVLASNGHVHLCHTNNADWCEGPDGTTAEHWRHDEDGHKHWMIFG